MKVLVTGGAGFIGSHIVDVLIKKDHQVAVIDNLSTGKKEYLNKKAKFYQKDINDNLDEIFKKEKPEIVIHVAANAMLRESLKNPLFDANSNIIGTINILECCKNNNVQKIIYTSTGGARYGEPKYLPIDEKHPLNPASPYGISKHTAEHYIQIYGELYNLNYLIFCFGNVYGPRDDPKTNRVIAVFTDKILKNENPMIFGDGNQTRDFVYVLDLANFIVSSIDKTPKSKLFNLANNKQISVNEIFYILKEISGFKGEATHIEAVKGEVRDIRLDTSLAETELGWNPEHDFKKGIKETFEWFQKTK